MPALRSLFGLGKFITYKSWTQLIFIFTRKRTLLFTMLHLALIAALAAPMREAVYPGRAYLQQAGCKDLDKVHPFCILLILSIIRDERVTICDLQAQPRTANSTGTTESSRTSRT